MMSLGSLNRLSRYSIAGLREQRVSIRNYMNCVYRVDFNSTYIKVEIKINYYFSPTKSN